MIFQGATIINVQKEGIVQGSGNFVLTKKMVIIECLLMILEVVKKMDSATTF